MALVYHMPEAQLNAWLATRIPRNPSRSGGLIKTPEIEPMSCGRTESVWFVRKHGRRNRGQKRRTFRDN